MTDNIILEIEESIKQERIEKLWKEYGSYVLTAAFFAVILTAALTGWRSWNEKINTRQTTALLEALEKENKAEELAKVIPSLRSGGRVIAHMTAAGTLLNEGRKEEALSHYRELAADQSADPVFRDLASLMAVRLVWDLGDEKTDAETLLKTLEPLWSNPSNVWQYHAHLEAALIRAQSANDYEGARKHLAAILATPDLPPTLIERARALDHVYNLRITPAATQSPEQPAAEEPKG